jgi:cytoskeleton protein RodZ
MKITGQILKENRERKNISISEVAIATKINVKALQAMEAGDTENLPPKTFLRGFVRSYASYLGLEVDSIMNTFQEEMGSTKPKAAAPEEQQSTPTRTKPTSQEANDAINPRSSIAVKAGVVAVILAVVVLIFFVKKKMESYEKETVVESPSGITSLPKDPSAPPTPPSTSGDGSSPSPSPTPDAMMSVVPAGSPTTTPTSSPSPTPAPTATATAAPTATPKPTSTPKPSATPTPSPTPKPSASPTPAPTPSPSPTPNASASPSASPKPSATPKPTPAPRPQEVIIEALDGVEVDVTIDEEGTKHFSLKGDQVQSIKARRKVVLKFSDGGAVNLIVNGTERGVPGDLGKPMRIELP